MTQDRGNAGLAAPNRFGRKFEALQSSLLSIESPAMENVMNWDVIEGNWAQYKGQVKAQWGKLTNDHLDVIAGERAQLIGQLQESYGIAKEDANQQVSAFLKFLSESRRS